MSRKQLIGWCLTPLFILTPFFIFAQTEQITVSDYFLFHSRKQNFSVHAFLSGGNVSIYSQNQFLLQELCTSNVLGNYNVKGKL